jgi:hypothetical protein
VYPTDEIGYNNYHNRQSLDLPLTIQYLNSVIRQLPNPTEYHIMVYESLSHGGDASFLQPFLMRAPSTSALVRAGNSTSFTINPTGQIDARNGSVFAAVANINYAAEVKYHFRAIVNVRANTYSIYVTPNGEPELNIGTNFAFSTEQKGITSIDHWDAISQVGLVQLCNLIIDTQLIQGTIELTSTAQLIPLGDGSYQAIIIVKNNGTGTAQAVTLTGATLGRAPGIPVPVSVGDIQPGASAIAAIAFASTAGTPGSLAIERYTGTYTGGTFGASLRVTLPNK